MNELKPVAWMSMDTPPKEEDGTVLVWAENMPVSMGCCEDGYYVFTECEDLHNYFEGNGEWLKEYWTLWMRLPDPGGKNQLADTHRVASVPQDVEGFIVENELPAFGDDSKVFTFIRTATLRAWMAGHVRVPVEFIDALRDLLAAVDYDQEMTGPRSRADEALAMLTASKGPHNE